MVAQAYDDQGHKYAAKQFKLHILHKSKPMQPLKVKSVLH